MAVSASFPLFWHDGKERNACTSSGKSRASVLAVLCAVRNEPVTGHHVASWLGTQRQVFRIITHNFADVEPGLLASLHDTPWTMIKLAHTARKQGLTEVCLNALSKLYSVATMDVQVKRRRKRRTLLVERFAFGAVG